MENDVKSFLTSKTFWGLVATLVFGAAKIFKFDLGVDEGKLVDLLLSLGTLLSGLYTAWGLRTATKPIVPVSEVNAPK